MDGKNNLNLPKIFFDIDVPTFEAPETNIDFSAIYERNNLQDEANQATIDSKELLKEIAENTAYLKILVEINRETNLNGDELNYIMRAIYDVAKASNKDEADNLMSNALSKINNSGEVVGNIANLTNLLMGIYNVVITMT